MHFNVSLRWQWPEYFFPLDFIITSNSQFNTYLFYNEFWKLTSVRAVKPVFLVLMSIFFVLALARTSTTPSHSATCSEPYKIQNFLLPLLHVYDLWTLFIWYFHISLKSYNSLTETWTPNICLAETNFLTCNLEEKLQVEFHNSQMGKQCCFFKEKYLKI